MSGNSNKTSFPKTYVMIEVRDKDGRIIEKRIEESKTLTSNFMNLLYGALGNTTVYPVTRSAGTATVQPSSTIGSIFSVMAPSGNDSYGVLIGSGTTSVTPTDYDLANQIKNTTMAHGAVSISTRTTGGQINYIDIVRQFQNNSGTSVNVTEVALVISAGGANVLIARDLLTSAVSVPNGATLTVTYTIQAPYVA